MNDKISHDPFSDAIIDDPRWNQNAYDTIKREIKNGNSPHGAAIEAGISAGTHRHWYNKYSEYRDFIDTLTQKQSGNLRKTVFSAIEGLEETKDYKATADAAMKLIERLDPEFGKKHVAVETEVKEIDVPGEDEDYEKMMKEAEDLANGINTDTSD